MPEKIELENFVADDKTLFLQFRIGDNIYSWDVKELEKLAEKGLSAKLSFEWTNKGGQ